MMSRKKTSPTKAPSLPSAWPSPNESLVSARGVGLSRGGFTLIELMVVTALLGLFLLVAVIKLDSLLPSSRLQAAAREIANTISLARSEAVSTGRSFGIRYDLNEQTYWLLLPDERGHISHEIDDPDQLTTEKTSLPRGVKFKDIVFGGKERSGGVIVTAEVSPLGVVSAHTIHLINESIHEGAPDDEREATLEIDSLTGIVRIHKGYWEFKKDEEERI